MLLKIRTSNTLIKFLGVGFIILGIIRLTLSYKLDLDSLLAFTFTAFLLILSDFTQFISEKYDNFAKDEKEISKNDKIIHLIVSVLHTVLVALSAISLIVVPYLDLSTLFSVERIASINDMLTLSGLGIAISLIGLKSERMQDKEFKEIVDSVAKKISREYVNKPETKDLIKNLVSYP